MDAGAQPISFEHVHSHPTFSEGSATASRERGADRYSGTGRSHAKGAPIRAEALSREEELSLFFLWRHRGDYGALQKLVLSYEPLVARIVRDLRSGGLSIEDAKQEARCGLLEAARRFDPSKGFRFGTYARWWILSEVSSYQIANRDILSSRRMKGRPKLPQSNFVSLDTPIGPDGESVAAMIPSSDAGPDLIAEQTIDGERMHLDLENALSALKPREILVVQRRHLSDEVETLQTVAQDMQITAERVRQIEKAALARLRNLLAESAIQRA
ncbi:RNA polymerase sigma-32 factor [Mesorhizobium albiziae]|uniref:RNA polymerase sigma-32 factor n=1 Tax=Neomesorhizobium albiziae TaxID=335020 RepID=A0A1I4EKW0_9HYPH|nr:sigma-70 family RNA polymerase sigma factor [Mesorhizobium albiziae]GLS34368.1 RNA polymerase sigma factor RpoH [Mesorhizobium albiziae]SFL05710.1 RNA polymerase sigma-32 factor [Mesorhizobium albiziae]